MNGLPWYKRYPRDFLEGTLGLTFEQKGSYGIVLDLIYLQNGKLPDDERYISGLLGLSVRKWNSLRTQLIAAGKITPENGYLINHRAIIELEILAKLQDKQRENASERWKNKDLQKPRQCQPEPEPESEIKEEGFIPPPPESVTPSAPEKTAGGGGGLSPPFVQILEEGQEDRTAILQAIGADPATGRLPGQVTRLGTPADMIEAKRWLDMPGLTLPLICAEIAAVMAGKRGAPPSSFRYFSPALQRLAGRIAADPLAATAPEAGGGKPKSAWAIHLEEKREGSRLMRLTTEAMNAGLITIDHSIGRDAFAGPRVRGLPDCTNKPGTNGKAGRVGMGTFRLFPIQRGKISFEFIG